MERGRGRWDEESSKRIISAESIERKISANKEKRIGFGNETET